MTILPNCRRVSAVAVLAAAAAAPATAAAPLVAPVYTQNFDTLSPTGTANPSATLPPGWELRETGSSSRNNDAYAAGTGSASDGDVYSFGPASSTERAFGTLRSGTLMPTIGAFFSNGLGAAITELQISYTGEMWRLGATGTPDQLDFQYSLDAADGDLNSGTWTDFDLLDFLTPDSTGSAGARDGNDAAYRTALSGTIGSLNIATGQVFAFRWNDADPTGADDGLAVDDFSLRAITATAAVPEPATWAMMIAGFGLVGGTLRVRRGRPAIA